MVGGSSVPSFDHVIRLGEHGPAAAEKLSDVYDYLCRLEARADAERLLAVDAAAERRDFEALERLVITERSLEELTEIEHSRVRRVVGLRNATALLPLILTWFILAWASWNYNRELGAHPKLAREPFLILWQQRFGGMLMPSFAETALISFGLLVVVLTLTVRAHALESHSSRELADASALLDDAMNSLALAVETSAVRPPANAQEWAEAAQRVLSETQQMIGAAVRDTEELAKTNNEISKNAQQAMAMLQGRAEEFMTGLAQEVRHLMLAIREDNAQVVSRTAEAAKNVLQQAGDANKQLIEQQMTPLFEGFRASLSDYRADQEVYRTSASALVGSVEDLAKSAAVTARSAASYTEIAGSIDKQLRLIGTSQTDFVRRITENSQSISTATAAMREVTDLMTGRMRTDIEALTRNIVEASGQLVKIDHDLAATSTALGGAATALKDTGSSLTTAAASAARAARAAEAAVAAAATAGRRQRPAVMAQNHASWVGL